MPRIEQGLPTKRVVNRASQPMPKRIETPKSTLDDLSAASFQRMIDSIEEERELRRRTVELLAKILEKLEEIRYGLVDNETGISNLLRQMKLTNRKLEELVDKRH